MNRTSLVAAALLFASAPAASAQEPTPAAKPPSQGDPVADVVALVQAAEQRLRSARITLSTEGQLPGGLHVVTRGTLHVLRGAQAAIHTAFEFTMGDGMRGRLESAQTANGIVIYEDSPAFGEVYVSLDKRLVADLEWAGGVLKQRDLPGMAEPRAGSPLGSEILVGLRRTYDLVVDAKQDRAGEAGTWLIGTRRAGLDDQDPDLPLADRVDLFVRQRDRAVLEVNYRQAGKVLQHIEVVSLDLDLDLPAKVFVVDGRGQPLRDVKQHQPLWELIEQTLRRADAKAAAGDVRPSQR